MINRVVRFTDNLVILNQDDLWPSTIRIKPISAIVIFRTIVIGTYNSRFFLITVVLRNGYHKAARTVVITIHMNSITSSIVCVIAMVAEVTAVSGILAAKVSAIIIVVAPAQSHATVEIVVAVAKIAMPAMKMAVLAAYIELARRA